MTETEADTRANRIDPVLREAGWGVVEGARVHREPICPRRITGGGGRAPVRRFPERREECGAWPLRNV
jgi:type I restriction enzyme R subunit